MKSCTDGGTCRNENEIEDLRYALAICVVALRQYKRGKQWPHIASDALDDVMKLFGPVEFAQIMDTPKGPIE